MADNESSDNRGSDTAEDISDDVPTTKTRAITSAQRGKSDHDTSQPQTQTQNDRLTDLFARQDALGHFYREQRTTGFYNEESITHCTTWTRAIVHECCELDNELNWKPWKNPRPLEENREERLLEMADILHFFLQLALDQGFSADDIYDAYLRKNAENRERQQSDPRYRP